MASERRMAVAAGFAAMALAACETPLGPPEVAADPLAGEWVACLNDGAADYGRSVHFYPDSFSSTTRTYATADRTCGGAETSSSRENWRYRIVGDGPARIAGTETEVLARQVNVENSFETLYTIVYVDELATPPVLYFGDLVLDPAFDGTAPERRPAVLSASTALTSR